MTIDTDLDTSSTEVDGPPTEQPSAAPTLPACLTETRCFTVLPPLSTLDDDSRLVTVLEVLAQESLSTIAVHVDDIARVDELAEMFLDRLDVGVHGVSTAAQLDAALATGAQFVLLINADAALVQTGLDAGVAVLPAALTPTEVLSAVALGAAAVQVVPADALGGNYAEGLHHLLGRQPLVARGGLGGWSAQRWYTSGAIACGFDDGLLGDSLTGGSLSQLRDRCRTFMTTVNEAPELA